MAAEPAPPVSQAQIWQRIIRPDRDDLSPPAAEFLARLAFDGADLERMHELAARNQQGLLSADEQADLERYREAGMLLDLLHSKARLTLRRTGGGR